MKDYYEILGIPDNASQGDIKGAFRKLAFQYHPDTNPGNEKQAEARFKEINEAYGVLGDRERRQQYDSARKGLFAGAGYEGSYPGFGYSQQDIFRDIFSNRATVEELNRMFAQAGLRFDQDFLNRTFFSGRGISFRFFTGPGGVHVWTAYQQSPQTSTYQPGFLERWLLKIASRIGRFVLTNLFGLQGASLPTPNLDHHVDFEISRAEADAGGEKQVTYQRGGESKKLAVKIPPGVKTGTKIRLKGMGMVAGNKTGNLYLHIRIKD